MGILHSCMSVCHVQAKPTEVRRGIGSPGTGVRDSCELPCRCWESSLGSLEEQGLFQCSLLRSHFSSPIHRVFVVSSLCNTDWTATCSVALANLELNEMPISARTRCITTPTHLNLFGFIFKIYPTDLLWVPWFRLAVVFNKEWK